MAQAPALRAIANMPASAQRACGGWKRGCRAWEYALSDVKAGVYGRCDGCPRELANGRYLNSDQQMLPSAACQPNSERSRLRVRSMSGDL